MYLGHVSGRKVVPDCRRLGSSASDCRLQIVGCKKDIPCVLASTLILLDWDENMAVFSDPQPADIHRNL